jgi:hypothetical protein
MTQSGVGAKVIFDGNACLNCLWTKELQLANIINLHFRLFCKPFEAEVYPTRLVRSIV